MSLPGHGAGGRVRPTPRGSALAAAVTLALAGAAVAGIEELYVLAAAALTLLCLAVVAVGVQPVELTSSRQLAPAHVTAGESAAVSLTVSNRGRRRSPPASLCDPFDEGRYRAAFSLAPLRPGEGLSSRYDLPSTPRGRYLVGPLQLSVTDPFGLVRRTLLGAPASPLVVTPRLIHLERPARGRGFDPLGAGRRGVFEPGGDEFAALRPYREGDDLRHVHWPSTARRDQLMVRQTDAVAAPRTTVAVDLRAGSWSAAGLEEALAAAGSVLEAARRTEMEVRLVTAPSEAHGPLDTGFGRSAAHWSRVLEALATAQARPAGTSPASLAGLLGSPGHRRGGRGDDTLVVVTSSAATEGDLRGLGRLAPEDSLVVVVFGPESAPIRPPEGTGRFVQAENLGKFAAAWDRLQARPDEVASR